MSAPQLLTIKQLAPETISFSTGPINFQFLPTTIWGNSSDLAENSQLLLTIVNNTNMVVLIIWINSADNYQAILPISWHRESDLEVFYSCLDASTFKYDIIINKNNIHDGSKFKFRGSILISPVNQIAELV